MWRAIAGSAVAIANSQGDNRGDNGGRGVGGARLERTSTPGVYARGSRWVAVYLEDGRQRGDRRPRSATAREIKVRANAKEAASRAGPTLHSYALEWVDHYAGRGAHDVINDRTAANTGVC